MDTGNNTTDTRELMKHVQSVTRQPVRYVVITQNHNDHSGGAVLFSPPAKTIVHERVAKQWASLKPHQITAWRRRFPERTAALERLNPTDTIQSVSDRFTLRLGGKEIQLIYVADEYNPGDIAVWLPKERILHASMAGYKDRHPDIRPDYSHGTTEGLLKQLKMYCAEPRDRRPGARAGGRRVAAGGHDRVPPARPRPGAGDEEEGRALADIEKEFQMKAFGEWDRTEHLPWIAATIHRELQGLPPQVIKTTERRVSGVVGTTLSGRPLRDRDHGRRDAGGAARDRRHRVRGYRRPDRDQNRHEGSRGYEVPEGIQPTLGYDTLEFTVAR